MSEEQARQIPDDGSPPGHIEKMLGRKSEQQETPAPEGEAPAVKERPDDIPEKFWDAEKGEVNVAALLKSQQDAEAALRQKQAGKQEDDGESTDEQQEAQDNVVEAASAEWAEKGELTDETYKALEGVGISRPMVDAYINGQLAIVEKLQNAAYSPFNGKDGYEAAADWAASNLDQQQIADLDAQLTSTNPSIVAQGAAKLQQLYSEGADLEPETIRGDGNGTSAGGVYKSRAEMMRDMSSARYRTDAAFRKEVMEKLGRSRLPRG